MSLSFFGIGGRRNAPLLLLLLALPLSLLVHCSNAPDSSGTAGGAGATTCMPPGPACGQSGNGGHSGSAGQSGAGGQSGGAAPIQACRSVADCGLPPSICSSAYSLMFYTNASCDNGTCNWQREAMMCQAGCMNGGCFFTSTTASGPPLNMSGAGGVAGGTSGSSGQASGGAGGSSGEASGGAGAGG